MRKKNPTIAAVLSLVLGPLGYWYIGWRYAVMVAAVFTIFVLVVAFAGFTLPGWMQYLILPVLAWKAFTICSVRNALIEAGDDQAKAVDTFPIAAMAMADLLVGMGMATAGALGLYASGLILLDGQILKALGFLLIGTPMLVWIAAVGFELIRGAIVAACALGGENVFRQRQ